MPVQYLELADYLLIVDRVGAEVAMGGGPRFPDWPSLMASPTSVRESWPPSRASTPIATRCLGSRSGVAGCIPVRSASSAVEVAPAAIWSARRRSVAVNRTAIGETRSPSCHRR